MVVPIRVFPIYPSWYGRRIDDPLYHPRDRNLILIWCWHLSLRAAYNPRNKTQLKKRNGKLHSVIRLNVKHLSFLQLWECCELLWIYNQESMELHCKLTRRVHLHRNHWMVIDRSAFRTGERQKTTNRQLDCIFDPNQEYQSQRLADN